MITRTFKFRMELCVPIFSFICQIVWATTKINLLNITEKKPHLWVVKAASPKKWASEMYFGSHAPKTPQFPSNMSSLIVTG